MERGVDSSFLARPSSSNPGDFTLSVRWIQNYVRDVSLHKLIANHSNVTITLDTYVLSSGGMER